MTVYVDDAMIPWRPPHMPHRKWLMNHMFAETEDELVRFARILGLKKEWLQKPPHASWVHFDVNASKRRQAIELGAVPIKWRDMPQKLRELRLHPDIALLKEGCGHEKV